MDRPAVDRAEGPAFPLLVKVLAVAVVAATLAWGAGAADELAAVSWSFMAGSMLVLALVMVLWCVWWILHSRTSIDATHIRQSWMWDKQVAIDDITQVRLVGVPYLAWLIAPRLVVRAKGRGLFVFHAADRRVLGAMASLVLGVRPFVAPAAPPPAPSSR